MRLGSIKFLSVLAVATAAAVASPASATILEWTLSGATFNDGGTASGSFDFNTLTDTYTNIDITTTTGSILTGATYTAFDPGATQRDSGFGAIELALADATGDRLLDINAATANFDSPGTIAIGNPGAFVSSEGTCDNDGCTLFVTDRTLTGNLVGVVASAPEPAAWALMMLGVFGIGAALRTRRQPVEAA